MNKKYLIFGASGSIGSALANKLYNEKKDCHLIGRNEEQINEEQINEEITEQTNHLKDKTIEAE